MRRLPRTNASPSFTSDVLRAVRTDAAEKRPARLSWRAAAAFAMAACLVIVVHAAVLHHAKQQRIAELRAERQSIAAELETVKQSATTSEPVVVLENDDGTRVIVDLSEDDAAAQPSKVIY